MLTPRYLSLGRCRKTDRPPHPRCARCGSRLWSPGKHVRRSAQLPRSAGLAALTCRPSCPDLPACLPRAAGLAAPTGRPAGHPTTSSARQAPAFLLPLLPDVLLGGLLGKTAGVDGPRGARACGDAGVVGVAVEPACVHAAHVQAGDGVAVLVERLALR